MRVGRNAGNAPSLARIGGATPESQLPGDASPMLRRVVVVVAR